MGGFSSVRQDCHSEKRNKARNYLFSYPLVCFIYFNRLIVHSRSCRFEWDFSKKLREECTSIGMIGHKNSDYAFLKSGNDRETIRVISVKFHPSMYKRNLPLRRKNNRWSCFGRNASDNHFLMCTQSAAAYGRFQWFKLLIFLKFRITVALYSFSKPLTLALQLPHLAAIYWPQPPSRKMMHIAILLIKEAESFKKIWTFIVKL